VNAVRKYYQQQHRFDASPIASVQLNLECRDELVDDVCVLFRHPGQYAQRLKKGTVKFHQTRLHHSGVKSAIGAMQRGNGLKRCRDPSELCFNRYFGLAVLGRNIHTLGKFLIAEHHGQTASAQSRRQAARVDE